jgi:hypothetical protein
MEGHLTPQTAGYRDPQVVMKNKRGHAFLDHMMEDRPG